MIDIYWSNGEPLQFLNSPSEGTGGGQTYWSNGEPMQFLTQTAYDIDIKALNADENRKSLSIINISTSAVIYMEFDATPSTNPADGSWAVLPSSTLTLTAKNWPEIRGEVRLRSITAPEYVIRSNK